MTTFICIVLLIGLLLELLMFQPLFLRICPDCGVAVDLFRLWSQAVSFSGPPLS